MNLQQAFERIHAPKGMTSVIAGFMSGNFDPIREQSAVGVSLAEAQQKLAAVRKAQDECGSDWAWWGYQGDVSYWRAAVALLKAAEIVGADNLPDVEAPKLGSVVMDDCAAVERFGRRVLELAKALPKGPQHGTR